MNRGYVKVWRKISDAGWFKNHKLCTFWLWCLTKASHKEYDMIVGCQQVHLMPGEFIFGRKAASKELRMSEQSIRTLLDFLKTTSNITIKVTNKFSIISIVNWNTYQVEENEINHQSNQRLTNKQPATNHKQTHKNINTTTYNIYGDQKNIKLTAEEYSKLNSKYGEPLTEKAIQYLSKYKVEKGYTTKSDYLTIIRWVFDAVKERENKNANKGFSTYRNNKNDRQLDPDTAAEIDRIAESLRAK
jgi:hypothetical protein